MQISKKFTNWSLRNLLILFLSTSLLFTILILLLSSSMYRRLMHRNTGYTLEMYASEQERLLNDELQTIKTALYSMATKEEVIHYLSGNRGYRATNVTYVASLLNDIPRYVPIISDVLLASSDGQIAATSFNNNDIVNFMSRYDVLNRYYQSERNTAAYYSLSPSTDSEYILAMAVPVQSSGKAGVAISFSTLSDLLGNVNFMAYPCTIIARDLLIYTNSDSMPDAGVLIDYVNSPLTEFPGENLIHLQLDYLGWDIFCKYPLNIIDDQLENRMTRWNIISYFIFALVESLLILLIYKIIISPIMNISFQSISITSVGTTLDNPAGGRNELNILVRNINDMVARTNQLTSEVQDARFQLMELEITRLKERNMFLQAQINPHFLYNMLECICGMASKEHNYNIRDITHLLSKLYQYSLRSPDSTLGEELECIAVYEKILQLQHLNAGYSIFVDVKEDLLLLPMPRMTLEPIVENSVQHGFERGGSQIFFVRITATFDNDMLHIIISDNGCGIAHNQRDRLNRELLDSAFDSTESREHIGLSNVNSRLRLSYGDGSGLVLEPSRYGGLDVHMYIRYLTSLN